MGKKTIQIVLICLIAILVIAFVASRALLGIDHRTPSAAAALVVNGHFCEDPAVIYWYGETALAELPLTGIVEGLGGQIQWGDVERGEEQTAEMQIGGSRFVLKGADLYSEDGTLLVRTGLVHRYPEVESAWVFGRADDCSDFLALLGYRLTQFSIDTQERTVRIEIEPEVMVKKNELQSDMVAFWAAHREEMGSFALKMEALVDEDPDRSYLYAVKEGALYWFDGVNAKAQGTVEAHPILADASFLGDTDAFEWVAWQDGAWFDRSACLFAGEVYDEGGSLYAELYLFYCEEEPVTDAYQVVEKLGPNWYFHCMYRE